MVCRTGVCAAGTERAGSGILEKSADFTKQYRQDLEAFAGAAGKTPEKRQELMEQAEKLMDGQKPLYRKVKNEKKKKRIEEVFYPLLCRIADIQGGRVLLKTDGGSLVGQLVYEGGCLTLDRDAFMNLDGFFSVAEAADDIYISGGKEGVRIQLLFRMYDPVRMEEDRTETGPQG